MSARVGSIGFPGYYPQTRSWEVVVSDAAGSMRRTLFVGVSQTSLGAAAASIGVPGREVAMPSGLGADARVEIAACEADGEPRKPFARFGASDRTALFNARVTVSDDRTRAIITAESVESPLADGLPRQVRARIHTSTFQMTQLPGRVEIVVLVFVDPGGFLPKWLVSRFTDHVARSTFVDLRRQVARKLYSARQIAAMRRRILAYSSVGGGEASVSQPGGTPSRAPTE